MTESRDESAPVCQTCGHPVGPDAHVFDWGGEPGQEGCRACLGLRGDQTSVIGHPFVPERTGDDEARRSSHAQAEELAGRAAAPVGTLPDASGRCFHCGDRATDSCPRCGKEFDERCRSAHAHDDVFQNQASQPPTPEPVTLTETTCERCGGPNPIAWHAPSPLWNAVMRESGHEEIGFICPRCFIEVAQERGIDGSWQLSIDGRDFAGTVSPDGRVWNPTTCLWEPVTPEPVCRECGLKENTRVWRPSGSGLGLVLVEMHPTVHPFAPTGEPEQVPDRPWVWIAAPDERVAQYCKTWAALLETYRGDTDSAALVLMSWMDTIAAGREEAREGRAAAEEQVRVLTEALERMRDNPFWTCQCTARDVAAEASHDAPWEPDAKWPDQLTHDPRCPVHIAAEALRRASISTEGGK